MIGLDTNVLVRHLLADDQKQTQAVDRLLEAHCTPEDPGFVNRIVLCELAWTLDRTYGYAREHIARAIESLLITRELRVEDGELVAAALQTYRRTNIGFSDALICETNRAAGCTATATFDRKAARLEGFLPVR